MFKVYKKQCKNCLLSKDAIVSPERRRELLEEIKAGQNYFVCHKSSMEGGNVCCRKFYDKLGHQSQMIRFAERLGAIDFVELPDCEKLISYREQQNKQL